MTTSKDLERKAERVRERLSGRLADLRYHASPSTVVADLLGVNPREFADDVVPALVKQARGNPIAFGLIAAGVGWFIFSEVREPLAKLYSGSGERKRRPTGSGARRTTKRTRKT
jgi:hypothetical protein